MWKMFIFDKKKDQKKCHAGLAKAPIVSHKFLRKNRKINRKTGTQKVKNRKKNGNVFNQKTIPF